tara:strand:+ start:4453 stop:5133 length:681 start_codon:yes stop_codon:yes gene_type:complete
MKNKLRKFGITALASLVGFLPMGAGARTIDDLRTVREGVLLDYQNGISVKYVGNERTVKAGVMLDAGSYHVDGQAQTEPEENHSWKGAVLGENVGVEVKGNSTDGLKSVGLETMVKGNGFGIRKDIGGKITGTYFRAAQVGKNYGYAGISGNGDRADLTVSGYHIGPKVGKLTVIPFVYGEKSLNSRDDFFLFGSGLSQGKAALVPSVSTSDFKDWTPRVEFKYKF